MSFGREKRLLLGWLAVLTPLPLPFNQVTGWPQVGLFWLATALYLWRAGRGEQRWLPHWAMNVLGLVYLPVLALDLSQLWRGSILRPLVQLVLFALAVKLWGLARESEKWHALLAIFFLFVAAMGTSVHPSVVLYFIAHLALTLLVLARFTAGHLLARHGHGGESTSRVPLAGFVAAAACGALVLAVPLFAALPRFQNPYIAVAGPAAAGGSALERLRDRLDLDTIGRSRNDRSVVLRLAYDSPPPPAHEARFRAAVFDRFEDNSWRRAGGGFDRLRRTPGGVFELAPPPARGWMEAWLQPQGNADLILPVDATALDAAAIEVAVRATGVVSLPASPPGVYNYRVGLAAAPLLPAAAEPVATREELDGGGITPEIAELAARVMGAGSAAERAERAARHLREQYAYSLELMGSPGADPVGEFLFRRRAGHCELFATSLVLMLRSQQIPARLVTGYLGSEYNPLEGYRIVRNANAHAWVEARFEDGWRLLDPTPPAGRPSATAGGLLGLATQAWDYLVFRWDRYVLSYGFYDQVRAFFGLRGLWLRLRGLFGGRDGGARQPRPSEPDEPAPADPEPATPGELPDLPAWLPLAVLLSAVLVWWRLRRPRFTATVAYARLRHRLEGGEAPVAPSLGPRALGRLVGRRFPPAAAPAAELIGLYLRESFGGESLGETELRRARELLDAALRELRRRRRPAA